MIKFITDDMIQLAIPQIKRLWEECFIELNSPYGCYYLTNIFYDYKPLVYMIDNTIVSTATLIPIKIKEYYNFSGIYIYGVGTLKEYRNKGIASQILDFIDNYSIMNNIDFQILEPDQGNATALHNFYYKRGYNIDINLRVIELNRQQIENMINLDDVLINVEFEIQPEIFKLLREKNFSKYVSFLYWEEKELHKCQKAFNLLPDRRHFLLNLKNKGYAILLLSNEKEIKKIQIKEFYTGDISIGSFFKTLLKIYNGIEKFEFFLPNNDYYTKYLSEKYIIKNYSMMKLFKNKHITFNNIFYFNFGFDI